MKHRISFLPIMALAALLVLLPLQSAHAHHESSMGSAFWHDLAHVLANGAPLLLVATAGVALVWYARKVER